MASTSSSVSNSLHCPQWKYHVFLSFRGEDTRRTFTGHLYEGLRNRGIFTFQDDKRLEHGDLISEELLKAIEESQVALIVFSKNYATSRWCLNELVKIMECKKEENGQTVIPIFYDVDPSHVRNQRESFAEAFAEHELKYKDDAEGMQKVQGWRKALTEAANLKGCDIHDRIESECIQELVNQISSKLCKTTLSSRQDIVGINTQLEKVKSLLEMEIKDVSRIVGIWGMGGVGKTTIARAIFDTLSPQFDGACFLADIKENKDGIHSLQNILLSTLVGEKENCVHNKEDGRHLMENRLRFKKVLIVLDDIDHEDHLDFLAVDLNCYGNGSRIIATTRDKHLIGKNDVLYEVTTLLDDDAIQLFNQYAFKKEVPDECFEQLSLDVVSYAKGLPLALKVWGSLLHKRDITEWRSAIEQMKINSNSEIIEKLKISFAGLEIIQQNIFLDIACFFRGREKDEIMPILQSCYYGADFILSVLIDKSLVFIAKHNTIQMHDLIQEMGTHIVKMQKDPGERTRIWNVEDFKEVMSNNTYPWESLPENFEPKRLVHLDLRSSPLRYLWIETKHLPSLRWLHLRGSDLRRTPDFTGMPNLEYLELEECTSLEEVHPSLGCCKKLKRLYMGSCKSLERFPYVNVESLEYLDLQYCYSLEKFPEILGRMKPELEIHTLYRVYSGMREISFVTYEYLTSLYMCYSYDLTT